MADVKIITKNEDVPMTAKEFAGITVNDKGEPVAGSYASIYHDTNGPHKRNLTTSEESPGIIAVADGARATIIDASTKEKLFVLEDISKEDTGKVNQRLTKATDAVLERVKKAVAAKDAKTLTDMGFNADEITRLQNGGKATELDAVKSAPRILTPQANTGPAAPTRVRPMDAQTASQWEELNEKVEAERVRLNLRAPGEENKDSAVSQKEHHQNVESGNAFYSNMNADAMLAQQQRVAEFLEKNKLKPKPNENSVSDSKAPQDRGISVSDMERISRLDPTAAKKDEKYDQMVAFFDRNGDNKASMEEILSAATLALRDKGIKPEDARYGDIIHGLVAQFNPEKLAALPIKRDNGR